MALFAVVIHLLHATFVDAVGGRIWAANWPKVSDDSAFPGRSGSETFRSAIAPSLSSVGPVLKLFSAVLLPSPYNP